MKEENTSDFKVGDKVSFTEMRAVARSLKFTVIEGKILTIGSAIAVVKKGEKLHEVPIKELRHDGQRNTLTEMLRGPS